MKHILSKHNLISFLEAFKINKQDRVWIHHPITEDLVQVIIKELKKDSVIISIPEDSPYYGQPDFIIKKTKIIGAIQ